MRLAQLKITFYLVVLVFMFPRLVMASTSCTASVSPQSVWANYETAYSFSIVNTGDSGITYILGTVPSSNFSPLNYGVSGWSTGATSSTFEMYGNTITAGDTLNFQFSASTADVQAESADWMIQVLGDAFVTCTGGPFGTEISGAADNQAPTISNLTVSGITDSQATIAWTTNESATSYVNYGSTESYGETSSNATLNTSHSFTLTSLSASTTYYYEIASTDASGNLNSIPDYYSFTTAGYAETSTVTITETVTVQATPPPAQTKTIIIQDKTPPAVAISTDLLGSFEQAPTIRGVAQDSKGVFRVDYSTDGGRNWLPMDEMSDPEAQKVSFTFTPLGLLDGNYELRVRAIDTSNNAGFSKIETLIIDRLPPRVGSTLMAIGPQPLNPTQSGLVYGLRGVSQRIILSSVGGATAIDLISEEVDGYRSLMDGKSNVLGASQQMYSLSKNNETGLWSGAINFNQPGLYKLLARAVDGAENKTERELQSVYVLPNGRVLSNEGVVAGAEVTVYVLNPNINRYVVWDGEAFLQKNPQKTDPEGKYGLILPPGKYYMEVKLRGHRLLRTPIFSLDDHTPINTDFSLEELSTFKLFGKEFYLPTWKKTLVPVSINQSEKLPKGEKSSLVGNELPFFILQQGDEPLYASDLVGKPTVLSFLTTWSPLVSEQMEALDKLMNNSGVRTVGVFEQETLSKVSLFMNRGGYETSVWADEDGELVEDFSLHTTPTHVLLDSKGQVRDVVVGFLSSEELLEKLYL